MKDVTRIGSLAQRVQADRIARLNADRKVDPSDTYLGFRSRRNWVVMCAIFFAMIQCAPYLGKIIDRIFPPVTRYNDAEGDCRFVIEIHHGREFRHDCSFLAEFGGKYTGPVRLVNR